MAKTQQRLRDRERFAEMAWTKIAPHAYEKRVDSGNHLLRLVRFEPEFVERDWCERPHFGYVVDGQLAIQFDQSTVTYADGDYIAIPGGRETRHRAQVAERVILFLVEPYILQ
jgi:quercetin dioxygenase-like cupin family protein